MDRLTVAIGTFFVILLAVAASIVHFFGIKLLIQIVFGLGYLGLLAVFGLMTALTFYARSFKYGLVTLLGALLSAYGLYSVYLWHVGDFLVVLAVFVLAFVVFVWYISEPDLSLAERFSSPESLMKKGRYRAAGRKFEKKGDYVRAAEAYIKAEMLESAAWAYEKAEKYKEAADVYAMLAEREKDVYYWKEAHELYKKSGDLRKAAECLERYAEDEPWFWEDVAELYCEAGNEEKYLEALKKALEYYKKEAEEEGVFWEDVAKLYEALGEEELAKGAWTKFARYCEQEAESDPMWFKHVAEAYEKLGLMEKAEDARKKYEEYRESISKTT
ncbi:GlcNAc transferase [Geoglobus acetivorans]|uniref:GlcNAc transferase n=1 Tax=Geoglobus acetivorans TaxID=565033 RepID=A0ABZ3GZW9_GEOAI|nr:GlcNAc transferase [Geoglobus acetivorans]